MGPKKVEFHWPIHYGLLDYNSFNEKKNHIKLKAIQYTWERCWHTAIYPSLKPTAPLQESSARKNTTDEESELGLDTEREKEEEEEEEEEDEHLELCGYGSQAHQREPLLRRQFHQPSRAQPNHSVTTLHFSHSLFKPLLSDLLLLLFFISIYEFGFSLSALGFYKIYFFCPWLNLFMISSFYCALLLVHLCVLRFTLQQLSFFFNGLYIRFANCIQILGCFECPFCKLHI